jgi:hydroxypyruvate reductase
VIGSGPTVGDPTTFADAWRVIVDHDLTGALPAAVREHLRRGRDGHASAGPVAVDDPRLRQSAYWIVASRRDAMRAAADTARRIGYHVTGIDPPVIGEARDAAVSLLAAAPPDRPACLVASGETTVHVRGRGHGGRNQELALAALSSLAERRPAALASIGTDGVDGPTDAAGAFVDDAMWDALGPDARTICEDALARNDAYPVLDRLGALVRTGPTGTNVGDLQILLLGDA